MTLSLSLSFTKDGLDFLCATPQTSLAGTAVNDERLHLFLTNAETEYSLPPAHGPAPQPPVDGRWGEKQRRPLLFPSGLGVGLT